MDIREVRKRTKLSQSEFHERLKPAFRKREINFPLVALENVENGDKITEAKMEGLIASIQDTFPDHSQVCADRKKRRIRLPRISFLGIAALFVSLVILSVIGMYFFNDNREQTKDIIELLNTIAATIGLLAAVVAIAEYVRKR